MNKKHFLLAIPILSILNGGTLNAAPPGVAVQPAATTAAPEAKPPTPAYMNYQFYADRYRDPFIALVGETQSDQNFDRPPQVASLILKGIVQDSVGRMALLNSGVSSYILRGGRLYNARNKIVKGISGVIKGESVVIIGPDRTVRELRVRPTL